MKTIASLGLALLAAVTITACGDTSKMKDTAETVPPTSAPPPSATTDDENKVVYHDALVGNDVTVKKYRYIIEQMPKSITCEEFLTGGKVLGNTYPNGEDFYLKMCKKLSRK